MKFLRSTASGFTLVELILAIGMFGLITAILLQNLFLITRFKQTIRFSKALNQEVVTLLNHPVASAVRSAVSVDYAQSNEHQITLFTNFTETEWIRLKIRSLQTDDGPVEQLVLEDPEDMTPLHTSLVVMDDFDVSYPALALHADEERTPIITLTLRAHYRHPFASSDRVFEDSLTTSYRTSFALRNTHSSTNRTL